MVGTPSFNTDVNEAVDAREQAHADADVDVERTHTNDHASSRKRRHDPIALVTALIAAFILSSTATTFGYIRLAARISETAKVAYLQPCNDVNVIRKDFGDLLDNTLKRSQASAKATIASPSSSAQSKIVAAANLRSLKDFQTKFDKATHQRVCVYPPSTVKPTT